MRHLGAARLHARHSIRHRPHSQVQSHIRKEEFVNAQKSQQYPLSCTAEQEAQLKAVIEENKHDKSMLMHVMQQAQQIYGYLPFEVQVMIADGMNLPLEKVYGVSTFYAQFALSPKHLPHLGLPWHRLLCQGRAGSARQGMRNAAMRPRRVHGGRPLFCDRLPLHRRLRPCPRHDD